MIELRNVSKVYQQKKRRIEAVKEVSLTIQQGEISAWWVILVLENQH